MTILVVGSVALDCVKTPFGAVEKALGGSALYFAAGASFFTPIRVVAVAGTDFPYDKLEFLQERGTDLMGLERKKGKTFQWHGEYTSDWNNAITHDTQLNVFETFAPHIPPAYRQSEVLFLANIDPELQMNVLSQMEKPRLIGLDTMNFWIKSKFDALMEVMKKVDIVFLNEGEAKLLSRETNILTAAEIIRQLGPQSIVIKKGEHGVIIFHHDEVFALPAFPVKDICDPTGAGDSFAAGFLGFLAKNGTFEAAAFRQAVVYGSTIASFTVTDFSFNRLKTIGWTDIERRFNEFKKLTQF